MTRFLILALAAPLAAAAICNDGRCDGKLDPSKAKSDRAGPTAPVAGRTITLHLDDTLAMGYASVDGAAKGDQVWLDRTWDGGKTYDGKLVQTTSPQDGGWRTQMINNDDWAHRGIGALRACANAGGSVQCTAWARTKWNADTDATAAMTALGMYYIRDQGLFNINANSKWWISAIGFMALAEAIKRTGLDSYMYMLNDAYTLNERRERPDNLHRFRNDFNDDTAWWALAFIGVYDFLDMARELADWIGETWASHKGCQAPPGGAGPGGVLWKRTEDSRASIANSLYLTLTAALGARGKGKDDPYTNHAQSAWAWIQKSGVIRSDGLVSDGIAADCTIDEAIYMYNQGQLISGLVELYHVTEDQSVLDAAIKIGDAMTSRPDTIRDGILGEECNFNNNCDSTRNAFMPSAVRGLANLNRVTNGRYTKILKQNMKSAMDNDRDPLNMYGVGFAGPMANPYVGPQAAALELLVSLM